MHIALGIGIGKEGALGGESPPAPGPAVDLIFTGAGTNDAIVDATSLTAGVIGSLTGWSAWGFTYNNPLKHTHVRGTAYVRRTPISLGGVNYDGTGTKNIEFDLSEALVQDTPPLLDNYNISPPVGTTGSYTATGLVKFGAIFGDNDVNFDVVYIPNGSGWSAMQYGVLTGPIQRLIVHGQVSGVSKNGQAIIIPDTSKVYSWTMHSDVPNQLNQLLLVDNATGDVIGTSQAHNDAGEIAYLIWQDYLLSVHSGGGAITVGLTGLALTVPAFPLETDLIIPIPTSVLASQSGGTSVLLTWTSPCQCVKIERQHNGGAWSVIQSNYDSYLAGNSGQYSDTGLTNGDTYGYRVSALVGDSLSSDPSSVSSVTLSTSLIAHTAASGSPVTTSDLNTTGANLIVMAIANYGSAPVITPSDSKGNTWTKLTTYHGAGGQNAYLTLYYCYNPTVGSGHNFTNNDGLGSIAVQAWGGLASSPFDQENGNSTIGSDTDVPTNSITPSQANTIVIAAAANYSEGVTVSVNNGFTKSDGVPSSPGYVSVVMAYLPPPSTTAPVDATFSFSVNNSNLSAAIANFKY
jgi:hypothetical protein